MQHLTRLPYLDLYYRYNLLQVLTMLYLTLDALEQVQRAQAQAAPPPPPARQSIHERYMN